MAYTPHQLGRAPRSIRSPTSPGAPYSGGSVLSYVRESPVPIVSREEVITSPLTALTLHSQSLAREVIEVSETYSQLDSERAAVGEVLYSAGKRCEKLRVLMAAYSRGEEARSDRARHAPPIIYASGMEGIAEMRNYINGTLDCAIEMMHSIIKDGRDLQTVTAEASSKLKETNSRYKDRPRSSYPEGTVIDFDS